MRAQKTNLAAVKAKLQLRDDDSKTTLIAIVTTHRPGIVLRKLDVRTSCILLLGARLHRRRRAVRRARRLHHMR